MDWHRDNISDKKNYIKDTVISWGLEIKNKTKLELAWSGEGRFKRKSQKENLITLN